jgi:hypothetical protein
VLPIVFMPLKCAKAGFKPKSLYGSQSPGSERKNRSWCFEMSKSDQKSAQSGFEVAVSNQDELVAASSSMGSTP